MSTHPPHTSDKRRTKTEILEAFAPVFATTNENIDFDSFAYAEEEDIHWTEEREANESVAARGVQLLRWLGTRPETEIAVVTHSSLLRHMFRQ